MATSKNPWEEDQVFAAADGAENVVAEENGADLTAPETNDKDAVPETNDKDAVKDAVQKLYIAYYGRPADPAGLAYWVEQAEAGGVDAIVGDFINSAESRENWGTKSTIEIINGIYSNAFGENPSPQLRTDWLEAIDAETASLADVLLGTVSGGHETPAQRQTLEARLEVADSFTQQVADSRQAFTSGQTAAIHTELMKVTATSTDAELEAINEAIASIVEGLPSFNTGGEFALTTSTDRVQASEEDTTFVANSETLNSADQITGNASASNRLVVDLEAAFTGFDVQEGGYLRNVQTVELNQDEQNYNFSLTGAVGVSNIIVRQGEENVRGVGELQDLSVENSPERSLTIDFENLSQHGISTTAPLMKLAFNEPGGQAGQPFNPVVGQAGEGSDSYLNLVLNTTGITSDAAAAARLADPDSDIPAAGVRTRIELDNASHDVTHLNLTGDNVIRLQAVNGAGSEGLLLTGEGNLDLVVHSTYTNIREVDATDASGDLSLDLRHNALLNEVLLGGGDNTLTIDQNNLVNQQVVLDGGNGNNTLILTEAGGTTQPVAANFQTLQINDVNGPTTLAAGGVSDMELLRFDRDALGSSDRVLVDSAPANLVTEFVGRQNATNPVTEGVVYTTGGANTSATAKVSATAANIEATERGAATDVYFSATDAANLIVDAGAYSHTGSVSQFRAAEATAVELKVARGLSEDDVEQTLFKGTVQANKATSFDVDASGRLEDAKLLVNNATTGNILVGDIRNLDARGDLQPMTHTLDIGARNLTDLTIEARGNLTLDGADSAAAPRDLRSLETLEINSFRHTDMSALELESIQTITLEGNRINSQVTLGDLGLLADATGDADGVTLSPENITLTAEGLQKGLKTGTVVQGYHQAGTPGTVGNDRIDSYNPVADVTFNLADVRATEGRVELGINTPAAQSLIQAANITINAAGMHARDGIDIAAGGNLVATGSISTTDSREAGDIKMDFTNVVMASTSTLTIADATLGREGKGAIDPETGRFLDLLQIEGGVYELKASGLTGNLKVGSIDFEAANADSKVEIDARNVTGTVTLDAINLGYKGPEFNDTTGKWQGNPAAAGASYDLLGGSVDIQLNGVRELVTLDTITAHTVSITANQLLGDVEDGVATTDTDSTVNNWSEITAHKVTFVGANLRSNNLTMNVEEEAHITGGIADDTFTVNATGTSLKLQGSLGLGENQTFTVDFDGATFDADNNFMLDFTVTGAGEGNTLDLNFGSVSTNTVILTASSKLEGFDGLTVTNGIVDLTALGDNLGVITGDITLSSGIIVTASQLSKLQGDFGSTTPGDGVQVVIASMSDVTRVQNYLADNDSNLAVENVYFQLADGVTKDVRDALIALDAGIDGTTGTGNVDTLPSALNVTKVPETTIAPEKATADIVLTEEFEPTEGETYTVTVPGTDDLTFTARDGETAESLAHALSLVSEDTSDFNLTYSTDNNGVVTLKLEQKVAADLTFDASNFTFSGDGITTPIQASTGSNGVAPTYANTVTFDLAAGWLTSVPEGASLADYTFTLSVTDANGSAIGTLFKLDVDDVVGISTEVADATDPAQVEDVAELTLEHIAAALEIAGGTTTPITGFTIAESDGTVITLTGTAASWTAELTVDLI